MEKQERLADLFEESRSHMRAVAYRLLGSLSEAEDAVQEAWLHLSRSDTSDVSNLGGWLTTVVARISLNMLRSRKTRREESLEASLLEPGTSESSAFGVVDPEQEALLADSVGLALMVILDKLSPAERIAYVLHDVFAVPFEEIAPIIEREVAATRQLASRARRRVQGGAAVQDAGFSANREVVNAFLAASRAGNFEALLTVLDPDIVYQADFTGTLKGKPQIVRGATAVVRQARAFVRLARFAQSALVNGAVGIIVAPYGRLHYVAQVTVTGGKITHIHIVADPVALRQMQLAVLPD
jgi:RNA polymerase sigma factor (sigma-70 family)